MVGLMLAGLASCATWTVAWRDGDREPKPGTVLAVRAVPYGWEYGCFSTAAGLPCQRGNEA